jgi:hypothetical protein
MQGGGVVSGICWVSWLRNGLGFDRVRLSLVRGRKRCLESCGFVIFYFSRFLVLSES